MANNRELSQFGSYVEVDNTTQAVGIATAALPYVGIGTISPQAKLHVVGDIKIDGNFTAASNSVSIAVTAVGADSRGLNDKLSDYTTVKDFGAIGNGINDDRFSLNDCQSNCDLVILPPGEYYLGGNYTFYKPTIFMPGAKLKMPGSIKIGRAHV